VRKILLVLVLITGLLVFGCIGGPSETQTAQPSAAQPGAAQQTGGTTTPTTGGEPVQPATQEPAPATGGTVDYSGMAYLELVALGVPIECDISSTYQGVTTTMKVYMVGEDKIRAETPYDGKKMITIVLGKTLYVTNIMSDMYPDCAWLVIEHTETEPTGGEPGATYDTTVSGFDEMPSQDFDCRPWIYDESKFTPPTANVCTEEEYNALIMQQYDVPDYQ